MTEQERREQLIGYLSHHGQTGRLIGDQIEVKSVWSQDGRECSELELIPATVRAVRDWLGY